MKEFLEYDESKRTIKTLNLDNFSVEDLKTYIIEIKKEIERVELEIKKKTKSLNDAHKFFK